MDFKSSLSNQCLVLIDTTSYCYRPRDKKRIKMQWYKKNAPLAAQQTEKEEKEEKEEKSTKKLTNWICLRHNGKSNHNWR